MKRALAVAGVVLALTMVLAACSDDGDGSGGGGGDGSSAVGEETTTTAPPTTTTTIPAATPDEVAAATCAARPARPVRSVQDPEITELSGIATVDSGWWVHNDSGDRARVFQVGEDGQTMATMELDGIEATDWEDITGVGHELFVGDIGDNDGGRPQILVHHVTLPDPVPSGAASPVDVQTITLHYEDGPRDAETLLIDPRTRELIVVSKVFGGDSTVYVAPEDDWADGDATLVASGTVDLGDSPLDALTSGDVADDGRVIVLRTYAAVLVFPRHDDQTVADALSQNAPCDAPSAIEVQGEAVAFTDDGYVTIGEGGRARINRFTVAVQEG